MYYEVSLCPFPIYLTKAFFRRRPLESLGSLRQTIRLILTTSRRFRIGHGDKRGKRRYVTIRIPIRRQSRSRAAE